MAIGKMEFEISVNDVQPVILKTLGITKEELTEWREVMTGVHAHDLADQIQKYIDMIVEAEKED